MMQYLILIEIPEILIFLTPSRRNPQRIADSSCLLKGFAIEKQCIGNF